MTADTFTAEKCRANLAARHAELAERCPLDRMNRGRRFRAWLKTRYCSTSWEFDTFEQAKAYLDDQVARLGGRVAVCGELQTYGADGRPNGMLEAVCPFESFIQSDDGNVTLWDMGWAPADAAKPWASGLWSFVAPVEPVAETAAPAASVTFSDLTPKARRVVRLSVRARVLCPGESGQPWADQWKARLALEEAGQGAWETLANLIKGVGDLARASGPRDELGLSTLYLWREAFRFAHQAPAPAPVRAVTNHAKGEQVVYTSGHGFEFLATVLVAHKDGSRSIVVAFPIRDGRLVKAYQGDRFRVAPDRLSARTRDGVTVGRLKPEADEAPRTESAHTLTLAEVVTAAEADGVIEEGGAERILDQVAEAKAKAPKLSTRQRATLAVLKFFGNIRGAASGGTWRWVRDGENHSRQVTALVAAGLVRCAYFHGQTGEAYITEEGEAAVAALGLTSDDAYA